MRNTEERRSRGRDNTVDKYKAQLQKPDKGEEGWQLVWQNEMKNLPTIRRSVRLCSGSSVSCLLWHCCYFRFVSFGPAKLKQFGVQFCLLSTDCWSHSRVFYCCCCLLDENWGCWCLLRDEIYPIVFQEFSEGCCQHKTTNTTRPQPFVPPAPTTATHAVSHTTLPKVKEKWETLEVDWESAGVAWTRVAITTTTTTTACTKT